MYAGFVARGIYATYPRRGFNAEAYIPLKASKPVNVAVSLIGPSQAGCNAVGAAAAFLTKFKTQNIQ